jgi:hypothetical protein
MPREPPVLIALVDDKELVRLGPGRVLEREEWALAVVSVEVGRGGKSVDGDVRATVTGRPAPAMVAIKAGSIVHVFLHSAAGAPPLRTPDLPFVGKGIVGGMALYVDGKNAAAALLDARNAYDAPPPKGVAQIYCRWTKNGGIELGCELRDFVPLAPGLKPPRLVSRFVETKSVITVGVIGSEA